MENKDKAILISGGSGYIASWVVKQLLEKEYTVHATVRDLSRKDKVEHLLNMQQNFPGKLKLFEADLLSEGSFEKAMEGCEVVIHMASPFKLDIKDPQKELVDPALNGTRNILNQVNKTDSVSRVVLTSSVAAVCGDNLDMKNTANNIFTEEHWNTTSNIKHQPYSYSKKVAEKEAWKMKEAQNRWDLVVINPSFVMGPSLSNRKDGQSAEFMIDLLSGKFKSGAPEFFLGYVDVRDVAKAHVLAATEKEASGRHLTCENVYSVLQISEVIEQQFPSKFKLPTLKLPKFLMYLAGPLIANMSWKSVSRNIGHPLKFDNSRSKEKLGLTYTHIADTMKDHANQLIESGWVKA